MSSFATINIPEQSEINDYAKELLALCKKTVADYHNSKLNLENLDKMRSKQHFSKGSRVAPKSFRRGVLMSVLQENAKSIPLWIGKLGDSSPSLCGAIPASSNTVVDFGDHVAALVPEPDVAAAAANLSEGCILAEVVSYDFEKKIYEVDDVDAEEGKMRYNLSRSKVIPLPKWKANPITQPEAFFSKGTTVLGLYPQTTCFYKAIVDEVPVHIHDEYSLYFEDLSYPEGYAPAIRIPQRYVIECPQKETIASKALNKTKKRK